MVGELCDKGKAILHVLDSTVVFNYDEKLVDKEIYSLSILTIVTDYSSVNKNNTLPLIPISDQKGTIGHAILKYKSGGVMILSAGHWIELNKLDVNLEVLEKVAEKNYGSNNEFTIQLNNIKNSNLDESTKNQQYNMMANMFVQQSAPSNYSKKSFNK